MEERARKVSRGERVGPPERDPDEPIEVGVKELLKILLCATLIVLLAGKFFTGDYLWEYRSRWTRLKTYLPVRRCTHTTFFCYVIHSVLW